MERTMKKKPGLYANINAKRKRIAAGSGERKCENQVLKVHHPRWILFNQQRPQRKENEKEC